MFYLDYQFNINKLSYNTMKKLKFLFVVSFLILTSRVHAQQLTVHYLVKFDVSSPNFMADASMPAEFRSMYATAVKDFEMNFILKYNEGESCFRFVPTDKKQTITLMGQTIDMNMMTNQYEDQVSYRNHEKNLSVEKVNFMGKKILIKDALDSDTFDVVNGETKEILGYECKKAVSTDKKKTVWFTEYIPVPDGPVVGVSITGLVLQASDGNNIYTATKIDQEVSGSIEEPTEGQVMTRKEFKDYVRKTSEMLRMGQGIS